MLSKIGRSPEKSGDLEALSMMNRYGLKADPWCNPTSTLKLRFRLLHCATLFDSLYACPVSA